MVNIPTDGLVSKDNLGFDMETGTPDELREGYRKWLELFAGSRVTEMLFNVNYQRACFDSKVWDRYGDGGRPSQATGLTHHCIYTYYQ